MLLIFLKIFEFLSLILFFLALLITIKDIFKEEILNHKKAVKDFLKSLLILAIFLILGKNNLTLKQWALAVFIGLFLGFITGQLHNFSYRKPDYFIKGGFIYFFVWALILWINGLALNVFSSQEWFWVFLSIISLITPIGSEIAFYLRKKKILARS